MKKRFSVMSNDKLKAFPAFASDEALAAFVEESDLSEYDFADFKAVNFEIQPKKSTVTLRLSEALLDAIKVNAKQAGVPYQRFMRSALEKAVRTGR
jgi:predicted DNA binding CopG/RHH family protein